MTHQVPAADWALIGKLPGDKGDYRILRGSAPPGEGAPRHDEDGGRDENRRRHTDELVGQVWAAVPSTPQLGGMPGPSRLPWATFTPRREDGQHRLAVTAIDATEDRDAVGRPTVAIRHVSVSFAALARERTGYRALYAALPAAQEMSAPLSLDLAGPDKGAATALADPECFDRAARLAALLLDGEVVITLGDQEPSLPERLAEFDRVMTLLPFGMRAGIALASWHDGTQPDDGEGSPFRLAYGPFPTYGQAVAAYGEPVPPPPDGPACQYLRDLLAMRKDGVARLAEHLGWHREPLTPGDTAQVCEILRSLAEPRLVVAAARAGRASVERIVNTLRQADARLDQDSRDELETGLLARDDGAAEKAVLDGWSDRTALLAAWLVLGQLCADGGSPAAKRLYALSAGHGEEEAFLATLAACRTPDGAAVPARSVAALIRRLITPRRGELSAVRRAVLQQPQLARWLLRIPLRLDSPRGEVGSARSAWAWLNWLDPVGGEMVPAWLRPYAVLTTSPDAPSRWPGTETEDAGETGIEDLALIVSLALRDGSLPRQTVQWWPVLLRLVRGHLDAPAAKEVRADLIALADPAVEPSLDLPAAVRLDTVRLYLGLAARYLPLTRGAPSCLRYLDALWELWSQPPTDTDIAMLTARLLGDLPAMRVVPSADAAVALLHAVVTDHRIPLDDMVAGAIVGLLAARPELAEDPGLTPGWWTRVERLRPEIRTPSARLRAAVRRPDADPVEIAVLCGRYAADSLPPEDLLEITGPWVAGRTPAEIDAMLLVLEGVLRLTAGPGHSPSADEYVQFIARQFVGSSEKRVSGLRRWQRRPSRE